MHEARLQVIQRTVRLRLQFAHNVGVDPHLGKEQIEGLLEAVSPARLREELELPHPPDEMGLMRRWCQGLFPQNLL